MTTSPSGFAALGVPDDLCARLDAAGITAPFPIQTAVIPDALAGRDVTGRAPTGSGKTLGFGIPVIARMTKATRRKPTALVLAPTRELAEQIATELRPLARSRRFDVVSVYGGVGYGPQRKALDAGVELLVACPGRLEDLIKMGVVQLGNVTQVVVDEADRMADMGFLPSVKRILDQTSKDRQVLLFSATLDGTVATLARATQHNPVRHEVGPEGPDITAATHVFWEVEHVDRPNTTAAIVKALGSTMVFCRTRHGADRLAQQLGKLGVSAAPIHGGRSQPQRDRALRSFSKGEVSALIATDVAARGVHVEGVGGVVHYDAPADSSTYVHRSGRTARAGASGTVVSLIDRAGTRDARKMGQQIGIDVRVTGADARQLERAVAAPAREQAPPAQVRTTRPAASAALVAPAAVGTPSVADVALFTPPTGRQVGTVTFFHGRRGYGFIDGGTGQDVFVHHTNVPTASNLTTGQRVEFAVRAGAKGPEAIDVVLV